MIDARGESFGLHRLTDGPTDDRDPTWSPDSKTIYFVSKDSQLPDPGNIWKVSFAAARTLPTTWGRIKAERR